MDNQPQKMTKHQKLLIAAVVIVLLMAISFFLSIGNASM